MSEDAHLNHVFWEDTVTTANFIHNGIPHKGINNKILYKLLYGEKVVFSKFKVFGCQVFFYVPKQHRNKLTQLYQVFSLVQIIIKFLMILDF